MGIIVRGHIVRTSRMIIGVMKKKRDKDLRLLGARIREMRQMRGLSQEQLALEAGLDRSYVGGVERGERNITFGSLCKIARALKTDVATLSSGLPQA
jgi:ribosome-binding protein aMBF1 (putative translation factor)